MDLDEPPRRASNPLAALVLEDLDPLSVEELVSRIALLEAEVARTRAKLEGAKSFRGAADALFRKS